MPRFYTLPLLAVLLLGAHVQAHETRDHGVRIAHPFATPTPPGAPNGAAYLDIYSDESVSLIGVSSTVSSVVEVHDMRMDGDTIRMRRLEQLDIPAGQTLKMRPGGGVHVMLIDLEEALTAGERFPLTLEFAARDSIEVEVWVQEAGEGSETAEDHHRH